MIIVYDVKGKIAKQAENEVEKAKNALRKAKITIEKKKKRRLMFEKNQKVLFKESKYT